ncbi:MAG: hypothetical protein F2843_01125 [Actinobacteria bacterium]|uniref:Unannotated protein n=1 Tax=freshwater metagenome TaxID=449393 RepID=A0A6J7IQV2_9ZZZZ|nr:hypothetical protein [Actinomycetota bacterium]
MAQTPVPVSQVFDVVPDGVAPLLLGCTGVANEEVGAGEIDVGVASGLGESEVTGVADGECDKEFAEVADGLGEGAGLLEGFGDGEGDTFGAAFLTKTPLFQRSFPLLFTQVYFLPFVVAVFPILVHAHPGLTRA